MPVTVPRDPAPAWAALAPTVRAVVAATVTQVPYDVERLLHVTGRLALWANEVGLPPDPDAWLRGEVIDAFVLSLADRHAPATLRTYRTWLRRVRHALTWSDRGEPVPPKLSAPARPHQPYEADELAGLRHWAGYLPPHQRADALALMGLGAGLGLMPKEVAATRGSDLHRHGPGHPLVHTALGRLVAARPAWKEVLAELAERAGSGFLFRPGRTTDYAKNLIGSWPKRHPAPTGLPALSTGRLRASWIVELMRARICHDVIATAAGLASAASLARYQHFVPPLTDEQTLRILRGQAP
ncbi:hypothetical protein [Streptacidiphilus sp. P02-A3a]|uniref:hypothetical protein n=1 Tax=Streptacidiphilus sp. P02-A3a TaxID=2704468 RepID=UPI0015F9836F|nr:hypothetical protein [Streptacidiphilus sp. P02-A3a]QMU72862.1 hypothetical protein GXP74_36080 [Streptacidiphilus sp. P02-A3a]